MLRQGILRPGMLQQGTLRQGIFRNGIVQQGVLRHGIVRQGIAGYTRASWKRKQPHLGACRTKLTFAYRVRKISARSTTDIPLALSKHIIH